MMTVSLRRNAAEVFDAIRTVLTPYVGDLMASTAAIAHCRKLGIEGPVLDHHEIELLLDKLGLGLTIFLGQGKTSLVIASLRQAIEGLQEAA